MQVSKSYVCDVEDGRRTITAMRIRQVAKFLGVSPDLFLRLRGFCAHCDGTGFAKEAVMIDRSDARVNYTEDDVGEEGECADCYSAVSIDDGCEPGNPLLCHDCEKKRLEAEVKRLSTIEDEMEVEMARMISWRDTARRTESALRALVESLPKCDWHTERPATRAWRRGGSRYCDECGPDDYFPKLAGDWKPAPDYPRAEPLRAALRLLNGEK